jgi:hypothetical protein
MALNVTSTFMPVNPGLRAFMIEEEKVTKDKLFSYLDKTIELDNVEEGEISIDSIKNLLKREITAEHLRKILDLENINYQNFIITLLELSYSSKTLKYYSMIFMLLDLSIVSPKIETLVLIEELFEIERIKVIEYLFYYLEERINFLLVDVKPNAGLGLVILRTCNSIRNRTSSFIFCGRISLFLGKLYGIDDKSCVNRLGIYNLENITKYNQSSDFWWLQDVFMNSSLLENKNYDFIRAVNSLLNVGSQKLTLNSFGSIDFSKTPKYLTKDDLLQFQLDDAYFFSTILIQLLMFLPCVPEKYTHITDMIPAWSKKIESFLPEYVRKSITYILDLEKFWINWKVINKCQSMKRSDVKLNSKPPIIRDFNCSFNNAEMNELWNVNDYSRKGSVPNINDYLEPLKDHLDPYNQIEEEYRLDNDPVYNWKALRLCVINNLEVLSKISDFKATLLFHKILK